MADWVRSISLVTFGALLTLVTQYITHRRSVEETRKKFFREKLVDLYSEIAALIAIDIDDAESQRAQGINTPPPEEKENRAEWANRWMKFWKQRRKTQRSLYSLSFQVRLLEQEKQIASDIRQLVKNSPFVIPLGDYDEVSDTLADFEKKIIGYEKQFHDVCDKVLAKYGA